MKKQQSIVGNSSINTLLLTSMSLLVAGPAFANGHDRIDARFSGADRERGAGRAERAERLAGHAADLGRSGAAGALGANQDVSNRIADRLNVHHNTADRFTSVQQQLRPNSQTAGLSSNALGEPSLNRRGFELDLSSDKQNVVLGSRLFGDTTSVTINVGGVNKTFTAGMSATAGEYVAIQEVLGGSAQSITLTDSGVASGGSFSLNDAVSRKVSSLVIPEQVSAVGLFDHKRFEINGDVVNHGTIYGVSTRTNRGDISIIADGIVNSATGLISTVLPSSTLVSDAADRTNLSLTAQNNINNSGAISSSDNVSLTTINGSITNAAGASISAAGTVNISTGGGTVNNAGVISSTAADINVTAAPGVALYMNSVGGTYQANQGNINIRDCVIGGDVNMLGGDFLSQQLNIRTASGALAGTVGDVTGTLNTSGYAAHFAADTANLVMGENHQDGDPTFANTGNILINGNVTANEDLTILAGGNITSSGNFLISTADSKSNAAVGNYKPSTNITLIAGYGVSLSGSTTPTVPGTSIGTGTAAVDFNNATGGTITLGTTSINTSSTLDFIAPGSGPEANFFYQENGGNVTLVAGRNGGVGGTIQVGNINTTSLNGSGGDVLIIGGSDPLSVATTIQTGTIHTGGAGGVDSSIASGGNVTIVASQANTDNPTSGLVVYLPDGSKAGGGNIVPVGALSGANANIQTGAIFTGSNISGTVVSDIAGDVVVRGGAFTGGGITTQAREIAGDVRIDVVGAISTGGQDIRANSVSNLFTSAGINSGQIYLSGSSVAVDELITGGPLNQVTHAGAITVRATTGSITTGLINAAKDPNSTGSSATVVLDAATTLAVNSASSTGAILGHSVILTSGNGITITDTSTGANIVASGDVSILTGNSGNSATISLDGGIDASGVRPGFVQVVNNAATVSTQNISIPGGINSNALAVNGEAGSIAVVSSGAISLGNISATSVGGPNSFSSLGGSVFISSGGTGSNAITVGTINTSSIVSAGNILLLSASGTTQENPSNIVRGAFTQTGAITGSSLVAGLNGASATIPSQLNLTLTLTGPGALNIRPGGYQTQQGTSGTPIDVTINSPDYRFLVPINVAATGDSIFLGDFTQQNGYDSFDIVASGNINLMSDVQTSVVTENVILHSRGNIISNGVDVGLGASRDIVAAAALFDVDNFAGQAQSGVVLAGPINASSPAGDGSLIAFSAAEGPIYAQDIFAFGTGVNALGGGVTLSALRGVTTGDINVASYAAGTGFNDFGGGDIYIYADDYVLAGDLISAGSGRIFIDGNSDTTDTSASVTVGTITASFTADNAQSNVTINTGLTAGVVTKDITTASTAGASGGVSIRSGNKGTRLGDINTSSIISGAGDVTILSSNGDVRFDSINASSFSNVAARGGNVEVVALNRGISWGSGDIDTRAASFSGGEVLAGNVLINGGYVTGYDIHATGASFGDSRGGAVAVNASQYLFMKSIYTTANDPATTTGIGGDVLVTGGNGSIGLNTRIIDTRGRAEGGSVTEMASNFVVAQAIDTSSEFKGGDVSMVANSFVTTFNINTSALTTSGFNAEAGSVELASATSIVFINDGINASASSNGGNAMGGSVGMVGHQNGSGTVLTTDLNGGVQTGIDMSATTTGAGVAVGGALFASAGTGFANALFLGFVDSEASGGATNINGPLYMGALGGSGGSFNFTPIGSTPAPTTFFAANPINDGETLTVASGNVTIQPGVYLTIGTRTSPVSFTLDFNGDSRLLVPLVTNGNSTGEGIFVSGITANNTSAGGPLSYQNDGYDIHLISYGTNVSVGNPANRISGSITANPLPTFTAGDIFISTFSGIEQTGGVITGNSLTLTNLSSSQISASSPIVANVPTMTVRTTEVSLNAPARVLYVQNNFNGNVTLAGINGVTGASGSTVSITGGLATDFTLEEGAVLTGSRIVLNATGANSSIDINGNISGNSLDSRLTTTARNTSISSSSKVAAVDILMETAALDNDGTLEATFGLLTIDNSTAAYPAGLALTGTGKLLSPQIITLSTTGNLDFGSLIQGGRFDLLPGQSFAMVAGGNITATGSNTNFTIDTVGTAGDSGAFLMYAGVEYEVGTGGFFNSIVIPAGNSIASVTGGSVILDGSNGGYIADLIDLSSASGFGGNLSIIAQGPSSSNNVILLPASGTILTGGVAGNSDVIMYAMGPSAGNGDAIRTGDINIGGYVAILGSIDLEVGIVAPTVADIVNGPLAEPPPVLEGGNGAITTGDLRTHEGGVYVFAQDNVNVSFTNATLNANDFQLDSVNGSIAVPVDTIEVVPLPNGTGGTIAISAPLVTYANSGTAPLTLIANNRPLTNGGGGFVKFVNKSTNPLTTGNLAGQLQIQARGVSSGGLAEIESGGVLSFDQAFVEIDPTGANADNGALILTGATVVNKNGGALTIDLSGIGSGEGGTMQITQTSNVAAFIDTQNTVGHFQLIANGGATGGNPGNIIFRTGGDLTVDPAGIQNQVLAANGSGKILELTAGTAGDGSLVINGSVGANGKGLGTGGIVSLGSGDANNVMTMGGKSQPVNGIQGFPTVSGTTNGTIFLTNSNGDVTMLTTPKSGVQGIYLTADGAGDVLLPSKIGNSSMFLNFRTLGTGDITTTGSKTTITASELQMFAGGDIVGSTGGALTVSSPTVTAFGDNVNIAAKKDLVLSIGSGATNIMNLTASNIYSDFTITAGTLILNAKGMASRSPIGINGLQVNVTNIILNSGTALIDNTGTTPVSVSSTSTKSKVIDFSSDGAVNITGALGGKKTQLSITSTDGDINTTGSGLVTGGQALFTTLNGAIGSGGPLQVSISDLFATSSESVNINNVASSVTLGNIFASNGDIDITTGTSTKSLEVAEAGQILATDGHITLQNNNATKGTITIGGGSQIATSGVGGGDVSILIGAPALIAGPVPVGVTFSQDNVTITPPLPAGTFFFGANGIAVSGTSASESTISMNVLGGKRVIFSTGALDAKAITVEGGTTAIPTTITADPPITSAPGSAEMSTVSQTMTAPADTAPTAMPSLNVGELTDAKSKVTVLPAVSFDSKENTVLNAINSMPATPNAINLMPTSSAALATDLTSDGTGSFSLLSQSAKRAIVRAAQNSGWVSETELSSGHVPGIVFSDQDLAIDATVSTVVDLNHKGGAPVAFNKGAVLFAPSVDTNVQTPHGNLRIDADSLVFVVNFKDGLAVFNVDDSHKNAVSMSVGDRQFSLAPGGHVLVTKNNVRAINDVNPAQLIGHRNVKELNLTGGRKAFSSEFSIPHAMSAVLPLKELMSSKHPHSQKCAKHLMKTVAIHLHLNQDADSYKQLFHPSTTAYAK